MLTYLGRGRRDYAARPIHVHARDAWEFQAILSGSAAPTLADRRLDAVPSPCLWIFPTQTRHGWTSPPSGCTVAVLHLAEVPAELRAAVAPGSWRVVPLTMADAATVRGLAETLADDLAAPRTLSWLRFQHAALALTLIALNDADRRLAEDDRVARHRCEAALAWYAAHLDQAPSLSAVARAVHVSPAHLRRLFHAARNESPRAACAAVRLKRARELVAENRLPLRAVAAACGFSDAAAFSRAFRAGAGRSPARWRATR